MGIPFTYGEQLVKLEKHLVMGAGVVVTLTFFFVLITSMNLRAAVIVVSNEPRLTHFSPRHQSFDLHCKSNNWFLRYM